MSNDISNTSTLDRSNYISDKDWDFIQEFIKDKNPPFLILSREKVENNYRELESLSHWIKIHYAMKACPNKEILKTLVNCWSSFEFASIYELDDVLEAGAKTDKLIYGNTIKKEKDIKYAYLKWIRTFACDSEEDLLKIAKVAPGSKVYFRLLITEDFSSGRPLSKKFWCEVDLAYELAKKSKELWLIPYGTSFHVWSYQDDLIAWDSALSNARKLFDKLKVDWIELKMLNLWGGMYTKTRHKKEVVKNYLDNIYSYTQKYFWEKINDLEIIMEPGSVLTKDIWVIVSEVVLVSRKWTDNDWTRRVYLDIWKFWGLLETTNEAIKYPIYTEVKWEVSPVILAWPTCDSSDVLYKNFNYLFPNNLKSWDLVYFFNTWAYTQSCSSVGYNWFGPLDVFVI